MSTIADYNNNPGNIRPAKGVNYEGLIGVDDRGFAIFENKDFGRNALVRDIEAKIKNGLLTPEAFIDRYAPASKENPEEGRINYKIFLADQLGLNSTADKFPENSAQKIADAIAHFEAGTRPAAEEKKSDDEGSPKANFDAKKMPSSDAKTPDAVEQQQISPVVGGGVGGVTGTIAGTSAAVAKAKYDALSEAYDALTGRMGKTVGEAVDDSPGAKWGVKTGYGKGSGSVQDASSAYQRAVGKGKVSARMDKLFGIAQPGESPELAQRLIDRAKAVPATPAAAAPSKVSAALSYLSRLGSMPVKGGLMGAAAGFGAADAYNRYRAGENEEATVGGLGTVASLVAPYVGSMGALPAAGIAAPLYLTASDRIRRLAKRPEEIRLQEDDFDAMGNPLR
jgi:hypothetical protein